MITIKVTPSKEFQQLPKMLEGLPDVTTELVKTGGKRSALMLVRMVKQALETQSIRMKKLSPEWAKYKARTGLDPRKLIATKEYLNSIRAVRAPSGQGYVVGTDSPYALVHEYGARTARSTIPARPHWRPTIQKWSKMAGAGLGEYAQSVLKAYFRGERPRFGDAADALDLRRPPTAPRRRAAKTKTKKLGKTGRPAQEPVMQTRAPAGRRPRGGAANQGPSLIDQLIKNAVKSVKRGGR